MREAFRLAEEEKPGAVHLEFPEDIAAEETAAADRAVAAGRAPRRRREGGSRRGREDRRRKRPVLVIGAGANRKMTSRRCCSSFVEKTGIPFITTQLGKGVIDEASNLYLGCAALSAGDFVHRAIEAADLIVNVGHDVIEKPPFFMKQGGTEVIHVSTRRRGRSGLFPADRGDRRHRQRESGRSRGQAGRAARRMPERCCRCAQASSSASPIACGDERFPIFPPRLVRGSAGASRDDGIICLDNGVYKIWFARNYPACVANTVLLDNALATMGAGLPSAMVAAMVYPDRKVMAICGDGGFMMNSQEMETAVRLGLDITVLILRDDAYGMIRWKQANKGFAGFRPDLRQSRFRQICRSYGAIGHRVKAVGELVPTLDRAFKSGGVHLVAVPIDYSENTRVLVEELRAQDENLEPAE